MQTPIAHRRHALRSALHAALILAASSAQSTILTFDGTGTPTVPDGYGDNVHQAVVNGITYAEGGGFTPQVSVDFLPDALFGAYSFWSNGYASLIGALGHQSFDVPGEIVFTPSGGQGVRLIGFDLATWLTGRYQTEIRIWDAGGTRAAPNLFSSDQLYEPETVYRPLSASLQSTSALHLYISRMGSVGIDNLHFVQYDPTAAVPEPATWLLGALGLLGLGWHRHNTLRHQT